MLCGALRGALCGAVCAVLEPGAVVLCWDFSDPQGRWHPARAQQASVMAGHASIGLIPGSSHGTMVQSSQPSQGMAYTSFKVPGSGVFKQVAMLFLLRGGQFSNGSFLSSLSPLHLPCNTPVLKSWCIHSAL